jgi:Cu/Ag efflux protein CusF
MTYARFALTVAICFGVSSLAADAAEWARPELPNNGSIQLVHEGHAGETKASGVVSAVDLSQRRISIKHGAIKSLGWPAMTMDFAVNEEIDLRSFNAGMPVNFTLVRAANGSWVVDTLKPVTH